MKKSTLLLVLLLTITNLFSEQYKSSVWISDLGNGRYRNPIIYADFPEVDVCKVGDKYYMVSASRHTAPGIPVLVSKDMVNWQYINYAISADDELLNVPMYSKGISHPSIRTHEKNTFIFFSDPKKGIFMTKTTDIEKGWEKPVLVMEGDNLSSPCPVWDANGNIYLIHGYEQCALRGFNNLIAACKLDKDYKAIKSTETIIFDTNEFGNSRGVKIIQKGKYNYIFSATYKKNDSKILCLRSESIYGPYESNFAMYQAKTNMEGPYLGAYIETQGGEGWYIHNQHIDNYGCPVMLNPVKWGNNWPTIGGYNKGGSGEPITNYKKPGIAQNPIVNPYENDEFDGNTFGLQWHWNNQPKAQWIFLNQNSGKLRLYSAQENSDLRKSQNILFQRLPHEVFTVTAKMALTSVSEGTRCGIMIMGKDYAEICLKNMGENMHVAQGEYLAGKTETENQRNIITQKEIYFRIKVKDGVATFSYSLDGEIFYILGKEFSIREMETMGARIGLFCTHPEGAKNMGWSDIEFVEFSK